jgi:hypothetical protein
MNMTDRDAHMQSLFDGCLAIARAKGADYSGTQDALANFKRNADRLGMTKYQVWAIYCAKHVDSIFNSIKKDPLNPQVESEPLKGRVEDAINYLAIFQCLLVEDEKEAVMDEPFVFHKDIDLGT